MPRHPDTKITLNEVISELREALTSPRRPGQCMSRGELADAVNRALVELYPDPKVDLRAEYVDPRWVGKLERGEHRWPSEHRRAALRRVFGVGKDIELDLYSPRRTDEHRTRQSAAGEHSAMASPPTGLRQLAASDVRHAGLETICESLDVKASPDISAVNHEALLLSLRTLAAAFGLAGSERHVRRRIGVVDVDNLTAVTSLYRNADRRSGGGVFIDEIDRVARAAADLLEHDVSDTAELPLFTALAEVRYLAGWTAFDALQYSRASRHFAAAERYASEAHDRPLLAYVRYGQAKQLQHQRDNREALQVLTMARRRLDATPALTATLRGTEAASLAALGDFDGARRALDDATEAHAAIVAGNEPERLAFRDLGEVYAQHSRVHRDWARQDPNHAPDAVHWGSAAIAEFEPTSVRSGILNRVGLTAAYFLADEPDKALAEGAQLLRDAALISSPRLVDRIANLRRDAVRHRGDSAVEGFLSSLPRQPQAAT
jgi:tetratricopeptide (TPR) repeat protein